MSKIGQLPIQILDGVTVDINNLPAGKAGKLISINGPKGKLAIIVDELVTVKQEETNLLVSVSKTTKFAKSIWGTTRKLIDNMVKGVSTGWSKKLELVGTGYRAEVQGNTLVLTVGYSHPIKIEAPEGINFKVEKGWLTENNADENYIVLNRYTTVWNELETSKISSEPKYAYYKALTPSFSYFSISVKENITSEISIENVSMASTVNFTEQTEVANESKKVKEEAVGKWRYSSLLVIAVVSFVIVPICYLIYKKAIKRFK